MTQSPSDENASDGQDVENDEAIGKALKVSLLTLLGVAITGGIVWMASQYFRSHEPVGQVTQLELPKQRQLDKLQLPQIPLVDITAAAGIHWTHTTGMEGEKLLPETMGGGVAVFDYDRDGDQDILFVGGCAWPWAKQPRPGSRSLCLYRNDGTAAFTDVTTEVGLEREFYGMGPAVGDFDNDGWQDLYVTAVGKNLLYHNQAGKFHDVTPQAHVSGGELDWSTGATWLDYDRDGLLDLFVCNYVVWQRELDISLGFSLVGVGRAYGQPTAFTGTQNVLYHNLGGGKFKDVSQEMGIDVLNANTGVPSGKALGVAAVDVDRDGWTDILVSNDTVQNYLFMNLGGKSFDEAGVPMGVAFDRNGNSTGAMGIDCAYLRNDDSLAVAIGNFANEQSSLYITDGSYPPFTDNAMPSGLGPVSRLNLTFGMFFADLDLDGRQDIVCSNGHLEAEIAKVQSTQQYAQPPQFFWNAGTQGASELISLEAEQVGEAAVARMVGRGAAYGDFDADGDIDIVIVASGGSPRVLRNEVQSGNHWLRVKLRGSGRSNRDALGGIVEVMCGNTLQTRIVSPTRSYLSQCETVLTFGLGDQAQVDQVRIVWPDQREQVLTNVVADQLLQIQQDD